MTASGSIEKPADLRQLFTQFLHQQAAAWQTGLAEAAEKTGEASPFQTVSLLAVDPRMAFQQALEAARFLLSPAEAAGFELQAAKPPADWPMIVRNQESVVAIPFCVGNYPQMMRNVAPLLAGRPLKELRPRRREAEAEGKREGGTQPAKSPSLPESLIEAAFWRLTQQYGAAGERLAALGGSAPPEWKGLLQNEEAALAWQRGDADRATVLWTEHPQPESPAICFNRGVAELFGGNAAVAGSFFTRAIESLPENSSWHDLAQLYRSVVAVATAGR